MIRVFKAMLIDSLRYLRSRYLFWIVLALSALVAVALFATYSFTPDGIQILWFSPIDNEALAEGSMGKEIFLKGLFNSYFVKIWLGWGAMILALISTASLIPDFISDGAVEINLSKPIRRPTLFLMKFVCGLLFVLLQLTIGIGLAYLIIGVRFDLWLHSSLLAIPLLTLQFLYLYAIAAIISVLTRSTIASLLGTIFLWFIIFLIQFVSNSIQLGYESQVAQVELNQTRIAELESTLAETQREPNTSERVKQGVWETNLEQSEKLADSMYPWVRNAALVELFIPKTGDLQKYLASVSNAPVANEFMGLFMDVSNDEFRPADISKEDMQDANSSETAARKAVRDVSILESILTSLGAVGILLFLATWRFSKRDF